MNKKLGISIGIIVLLTGYIFFKNMKGGNLPDLSPWEGSAGEIRIEKDGTSMVLTNEKEKWFVSEKKYPAGKTAVEAIESRIKNLKLDSLISKRKEYNTYELTPEKATVVTVKKDGKLLRKLMVGKTSSTNKHTYVRIDNRPEVYQAVGTFDRDFDKAVGELRDTEIFTIAKEAITALDIKYKGKLFSFSKTAAEKKEEKKESKADSSAIGTPAEKGSGLEEVKTSEKTEKWVCKGYELVSLSNSKLSPLLSSFSPVKAAGYPEMEKKDLKNPLTEITVKAYDRDVTLFIYKQNADKDYIAVSSESPYVFTLREGDVEKYIIDNIEKFKEDKK
ncbi:MAG: DUF4340 domain-containing protein [bacterium]|nr:DUF4340 domain-containing protein [bacterium]